MSGVQRSDMGGYLCIASNGIPPSVSKRYDVQVNCKCPINWRLYPRNPLEKDFGNAKQAAEAAFKKFSISNSCKSLLFARTKEDVL